MKEQSVIGEQQGRVAAYAAMLPDIAAVQAHGQHALVAACLSALARLRVADHIDGRRGLKEIATNEQVDLLALQRVMRFLEPHDVFEVADGRVLLTGKGRLLRSDSPVWSSLVLRGANAAIHHLDHSLKTGQAAFPQAYGADFWSFLATHSGEQEAFADAMRLQEAMFSVACVPVMDFVGGHDGRGCRRGRGGFAGGHSGSEPKHAWNLDRSGGDAGPGAPRVAHWCHRCPM